MENFVLLNAALVAVWVTKINEFVSYCMTQI
jgi:hypothetical protein